MSAAAPAAQARGSAASSNGPELHAPFLILGSNGVGVDLNFPPSTPRPEHFWALVEYIKATSGPQYEAEMQRLAKRKREYLEPVSVVDLTKDGPDVVSADAVKHERLTSPPPRPPLPPSADAEALERARTFDAQDDDSTSATDTKEDNAQVCVSSLC